VNIDRTLEGVLKPHAELTVAEWAELNRALQANASAIFKAATTGYPTQAVAGTNAFGALVPQSIETVMTSASWTDKAICLWNLLQKVPVYNTLHESVIVQEYGEERTDPWITEGGVGPEGASLFERALVKVKYLSEKRELTDVSTMVGTVGGAGVAPRGLAIETRNGTKNLLGKLESSLFWADSDLSPLAFDGLYKQVNAANPENIGDNRGLPTSPQDLTTILFDSFGAPQYAEINTILVEPSVYGSLLNIATAYARHPQPTNVTPQRYSLVFNANELTLMGPVGPVPIKSAAKMFPPRTPNTVAVGNNPPSPAPVLDSATAGSHASSEFEAADAGLYYYKVVGVGDDGISAPLTSSQVTISEGDRVTFTIDDEDPGGNGQIPLSGDNSIRYYRVYRSDKNGAASTCSYMWSFARNTDGGSDETVFYDTNAYLPKTSTVWPLSLRKEHIYWAKFLDFFRRPLAQVATSVPFLLLLLGALHVRVPRKQYILQNVALHI